MAGALFVLPSLVMLIALSWLYMAYGDVPAVAGILYGIKPAVVAIVLHAAWRIGSRALKRPDALGDRRGGVRRDLRVRTCRSRRSCSPRASIGYVGGRIAPARICRRRRPRRAQAARTRRP